MNTSQKIWVFRGMSDQKGLNEIKEVQITLDFLWHKPFQSAKVIPWQVAPQQSLPLLTLATES